MRCALLPEIASFQILQIDTKRRHGACRFAYRVIATAVPDRPPRLGHVPAIPIEICRLGEKQSPGPFESGKQCSFYSYKLKTAKERPLAEIRGHNGRPSIHGQRMTWQQFQEDDESVIVLLDLETGEQTIIGDGGCGGSSPVISKDYVDWAVAEPCDVFGIPPGKAQTSVYSYRLKSAEVRELSNNVEPMAMLHANVAVIAEVCFGVRRQYAVHLD